MILYALYRIGIFFVPILPLRFCYAVGCLLAEAVCFISRKDRAAVIKNLTVVTAGSVGERELGRMARGVFRNFAKYLVDFFRFEKIDKKYVDASVTIEGIENLDEALARGKGVILLSAHIGNWELAAAVFSLIGYRLSAVVLTHENKMINDFFTRQRRSASMEPIEIGASLKACYRVLKHNGFLALLGDRDFTKNGLPVEFFGKMTLVPRGPAIFGYRVGSAVVPTFMVREKGDKFRFVFERPLFADRAQEEHAAIDQLVRAYLAVIESYIKRYPTQWYVFREMWDVDPDEVMRPDTII